MSQQFKKSNYFVLTGAMGAGKSTLLQELMALNFRCIEEPARPIIAEQREIEGEGIYDKDMKLFIELMLSRAIFQYKQMQDWNEPVIFDRGIPDLIEYANSAKLNLPHTLKASEKYQYSSVVFFTPGWQEIYTTDADRKMSFVAAEQFGENVRNIYLSLGYKIVTVPLATPKQRANFIANAISKYLANDA